MVENFSAAIKKGETEKSSFFADSLRPTNGNMEIPKLKNTDSHLQRKFNDSDRPNSGAGIEQPKLRDADDRYIPCRNEELAGKKHPITGVPFEKRTVVADGVKKEAVVPRFDSIYDARLPKDKLTASDAVQFKECNKQLKEAVHSGCELRGITSEQLEQIKNGDTPDGYTWHHDADAGKMQLVNTDIHQLTGHTGGRSIWGGGSDNR